MESRDLRLLERIAARDGRTVDDLVSQAVHDYLARHANGDGWRGRFDHLLERIQSRRPPDISTEEIEADITAARNEVRQIRRAHRG